MIVATFLVGELMRPEPFGRSTRRPLDLAIGTYAQTAAEIYERKGQTALIAYIDQVQRESNIRAFLFNSQLQELSGRRIPAAAPAVAQKVFQTQLPEFVSKESAPLLARPALTARGQQYVLVAEMLGRPPQPDVFNHLLHVLAIGLVGAASCYWLARYLTSPVTKLRAATQELASGNLSARVASSLGNRRDELASLAADFDQMAEKIESLVNSQRRLLGDISHELRSPLARLNVALELARQRSGADAASALERIQREAENLNEMIGQLLALTRLESGAEAQGKTEFDLVSLVQEIADDADFEARSRNRSVKLETTGRCKIVGTEHLLRRAIENVVRNAVQYTAEGTEVQVQLRQDSGRACVDSGSVQLTAGNSKTPGGGSQRCVVITVRDHGAGVPENALAEIFRPFYRVDDARVREGTSEGGGVGLGLAIAERAVRLHRGSARAVNHSAGGLIVTIILPGEQTANSKSNQQTAINN